MTPKLLSPEELRRILKRAMGHEGTWHEIDLLKDHIAALEAECADLLAGQGNLQRTIARMESDHAKALARARNEGIEHVAMTHDVEATEARRKEAIYVGQPIAREWAREAARHANEATRIRALKEAES